MIALLRRLAGSLWFRVAVTLALLIVVLNSIDWSLISDRISDGKPQYGALAVLAIVGALTIGALRWNELLKLAGIRVSRRELIRIYAVTSFANAFLPTSVGGDVARPLMVSRRAPLLMRTIATVVIERLLALVALVALAWVGAALVPSAAEGAALGALVIVSAGLLTAAAVLAMRPKLFGRLLRQLVPDRFAAHLSEASEAIRSIMSSPRRLAIAFAQSVVFQMLVTIQLVLLGKMIGVELSFGLAAIALALVTLATLLPISIGGFGVREGSYVVILAGGGIGHTDAVLLSLLTVVVLFLATLPGAIELVRGGFTPAPELESR